MDTERGIITAIFVKISTTASQSWERKSQKTPPSAVGWL